ncbi:hypothetical protein E2C01_035939 [Portunus trituberculatus]|uniref:Uncharacterized protein n=1 Tax=Portunus trituberculatus TaxID=210409 RepID=A0A5B7F4H7_PORTR|nr:hypothetical protein [Portunus trituberculatus]
MTALLTYTKAGVTVARSPRNATEVSDEEENKWQQCLTVDRSSLYKQTRRREGVPACCEGDSLDLAEGRGAARQAGQQQQQQQQQQRRRGGFSQFQRQALPVMPIQCLFVVGVFLSGYTRIVQGQEFLFQSYFISGVLILSVFGARVL